MGWFGSLNMSWISEQPHIAVACVEAHLLLKACLGFFSLKLLGDRRILVNAARINSHIIWMLKWRSIPGPNDWTRSSLTVTGESPLGQWHAALVRLPLFLFYPEEQSSSGAAPFFSVYFFKTCLQDRFLFSSFLFLPTSRCLSPGAHRPCLRHSAFTPD